MVNLENSLWMEQVGEEATKYKKLVLDVISYLKKEKEHEGTSAVSGPSEILDKILGMAGDLQEVKDKIMS